ncbi:uncharacterized protein METZ01_LOCUS429947 [marine metagenome]|uniref:Uncharacterized protein n=1 Tax=marine metagenome TaxID=408172 RepID=A0A382Y1H4_9ZZZZ
MTALNEFDANSDQSKSQSLLALEMGLGHQKQNEFRITFK